MQQTRHHNSTDLQYCRSQQCCPAFHFKLSKLQGGAAAPAHGSKVKHWCWGKETPAPTSELQHLHRHLAYPPPPPQPASRPPPARSRGSTCSTTFLMDTDRLGSPALFIRHKASLNMDLTSLASSCQVLRSHSCWLMRGRCQSSLARQVLEWGRAGAAGQQAQHHQHQGVEE